MAPYNDFGVLQVSHPENVELDVVLVHGLNGGRSSTWTNSKDEFWPTWLNESIQGARVWVYGYNANVWYSSSNDHVVLHATKLLKELAENKIGISSNNGALPVVLVGHSLGGILIKQAMILANARSDLIYSYLSDAVVAVCFCGTPHRGSIWANRLHALTLRQASSFVALLKSGKPRLLANIADQFNNLWGDKPVLTFIELKPIFPIGIIVSQHEAVTNCRNEQPHEIQKDHRELVRPINRSSPFYATLVEKLTEFKGLKPRSSASQETPQDPYNEIRLHVLSQTLPSGCRKRIWKEFCDSNSPWEYAMYPDGTSEFEGSVESFQGGVFSYYWPPNTNTCITMNVDLSVMKFDWSIYCPDSVYYPGRHCGNIKVSDEYPSKSPHPSFDTPLLCAFLNERGYLSSVLGAWGAFWSPALTLSSITSSFATFIHFGPLLEGASEATLSRYLGFHPFNEQWKYMINDKWFRDACNFFCRAYNTPVDEEYADTNATEDMRQTSISALQGLFNNAFTFSSEPKIVKSAGSSPVSLQDSFSEANITSRRDWATEENLWARAITSLNRRELKQELPGIFFPKQEVTLSECRLVFNE